MPTQPALAAWGVTALLLLVWAATTLVAERTVPTLLLTYFVLPQAWVVLAALTLLVSAARRDGTAVLGGMYALGVAFAMLDWHPRAHPRARIRPTFRVMTYNVARGASGAAPIA